MPGRRVDARFEPTRPSLGRHEENRDGNQVVRGQSPSGEPGRPPVQTLIFVHGGGWNSYDKELFTPVAIQLLPEEMVVVIPDYTIHRDATHADGARGGRRDGLESPIMTAVMEGTANFASASPISYTSGFGAPWTALFHGAADETVALGESDRMYATLEEAGHSDFLFRALGEDDGPVILDIGRIVYE